MDAPQVLHSPLCSRSFHGSKQRRSGDAQAARNTSPSTRRRSEQTTRGTRASAPHCGKHFETRKLGRKYCSRECFDLGQRNITTSHAKPVENSFARRTTAMEPRATAASRAPMRRRRLPPRECMICGQTSKGIRTPATPSPAAASCRSEACGAERQGAAHLACEA